MPSFVLVGYGRFVGAEATVTIVRHYDAVRLHGNLIQPSFKLREKTRIGARVIIYHPPAPRSSVYWPIPRWRRS